MTHKSSRGRTSVPSTRKSLLLRLKNWRDQDSWGDFCKIYEKMIRDTAIRSGLTEVESQEVVQETLLAVAKKMAGFQYDPEMGSFRNWLLRITRRRIVDQFRRRRPNQVTLDPEKPPEEAIDVDSASSHRFESLWNEEWHQALMEMARVIVKKSISAKQYRMFELYALEQKPMKEVTRKLQVNAAQVYMAKYRVTRMLRKEIERLKEDQV